MDFYLILTLGLIVFTAGYWIGRHDKAPTITPPLDTESLQNRVNQQEGALKALRQVMHDWHQQAVDMGFDGVHCALEHIRSRRHTKVRVIVEQKTGPDAHSNVVDLLHRQPAKGAHL